MMGFRRTKIHIRIEEVNDHTETESRFDVTVEPELENNGFR